MSVSQDFGKQAEPDCLQRRSLSKEGSTFCEYPCASDSTDRYMIEEEEAQGALPSLMRFPRYSKDKAEDKDDGQFAMNVRLGLTTLVWLTSLIAFRWGGVAPPAISY